MTSKPTRYIYLFVVSKRYPDRENDKLLFFCVLLVKQNFGKDSQNLGIFQSTF